MSDVKLFHGDCLDVLKNIPDNSIDSIVTDPPYGISFMGKKWDYDIPKAEVWEECLRVLKPGGHLVAFAGTRTQHRMCSRIEDAGFEIRDMLAWLYGCLDETSEILTEGGWKKGIAIEIGEKVAQWDSIKNEIIFGDVLNKTVSPFNGEMINLKNDNTDQLLTPNHRVYHIPRQREQIDWVRKSWFGDDYLVKEAKDFDNFTPFKLPIASIHSGPGIGGVDYARLLAWIWTEGGFDRVGTGVRIYQSKSANPDKVEVIQSLLEKFVTNFKRYERDRIYTHKNKSKLSSEVTWYFSGDFANKIRQRLPEKHPTWELLWEMTFDEKIAFYEAAMMGDGSGTGFYQKDKNDLIWFQTLLHMINKQGRINFKKIAVAVHDNPKTEFQARHLKKRTMTYNGLVWCVEVSTGAFVAKRNDKIFITGNSGFPKSHNIGKAVDKIQGNERKQGKYLYTSGSPKNSVSMPAGKDFASTGTSEWEGWGTALKPELEPITLARKPISENTIAENVLKWGTGAINIDGCRVGTDILSEIKAGQAKIGTFERQNMITPERVGRFPANILHDGSEEVLGIFPDTGKSGIAVQRNRDGGVHNTIYGDYKKPPTEDHGFNDSGSAARFFYCAKASKKDRDEGLENFEPTRKAGAEFRPNPHPTVKPTDLMRYLCRLITPPGGVILDPFMGSGSTGKAARLEGFSFVGIEMQQDYLDIAKARIDAVTPPNSLDKYFAANQEEPTE